MSAELKRLRVRLWFARASFALSLLSLGTFVAYAVEHARGNDHEALGWFVSAACSMWFAEGCAKRAEER